MDVSSRHKIPTTITHISRTVSMCGGSPGRLPSSRQCKASPPCPRPPIVRAQSGPQVSRAGAKDVLRAQPLEHGRKQGPARSPCSSCVKVVQTWRVERGSGVRRCHKLRRGLSTPVAGRALQIPVMSTAGPVTLIGTTKTHRCVPRESTAHDQNLHVSTFMFMAERQSALFRAYPPVVFDPIVSPP
jgi:hypothetical protein